MKIEYCCPQQFPIFSIQFLDSNEKDFSHWRHGIHWFTYSAELIQAGYDVIIIDNLSNSHAEVIDAIQKITGVKPAFFDFDLCNKKFVIDLFQKHQVDAIIHFAAFKAVGESVENPLKYYHNNLVSLINLLEAAKQH